ncbi:MAG: GNAT family N-acetyltransferase [Pseudomonadota bacterium]
MTLEARDIHRDHLSALFKLKVRDDQDGLVAPNAITLAQQAYEPDGAHVWGLWDGDTAVGLMAMIDCRNYADLEDGDDPNSAYLWRLMIGADHQGQGYGRAAMALAEGIARDWAVSKLTLTVVDKPNAALGFYEGCGYVLTGRVVEGEREMAKAV